MPKMTVLYLLSVTSHRANSRKRNCLKSKKKKIPPKQLYEDKKLRKAKHFNVHPFRPMSPFVRIVFIILVTLKFLGPCGNTLFIWQALNQVQLVRVQQQSHVTGVSHTSSKNCPHLVNSLNSWNSNYLLLWANSLLPTDSFLALVHFFRPELLQSASHPRPVLQHSFTLHLFTKLIDVLLSHAGVSCIAVSMATSWQCHPAEGHITAQPSGRLGQLQLLLSVQYWIWQKQRVESTPWK